MTSPLIQPDLMLYSVLSGVLVGGGGFVLVSVFALASGGIHPETAQVWNLLWIALSFTGVLAVLGIDVFVGGPGDFLYVLLVGFGATVGYLLGAFCASTELAFG